MEEGTLAVWESGGRGGGEEPRGTLEAPRVPSTPLAVSSKSLEGFLVPLAPSLQLLPCVPTERNREARQLMVSCFCF